MGARIVDRDNGYAAMRRRVFGKRKTSIAVGILDGEAPEGDGGATLLEVATIQEFGASWVDEHGHAHEIPERSFIRAYIDEHERDILDLKVRLMQSVIAGRRTQDEILEILGQYVVAGIQKRIADGIPPPNAPATIERKGSSTPLIDKGELRSHVTYAVRAWGSK